MKIDVAHADSIVRSIAGEHPLSPSAADAIVKVAWLAIDADMMEDAEELASIEAISDAVRAKAGVSAGEPLASIEDIPTDDEEIERRLEQLMAELPDRWSRELAYAFAHVLTVVDYEISPSEDAMLVHMRECFGLVDERANELAAMALETVQPA